MAFAPSPHMVQSNWGRTYYMGAQMGLISTFPSLGTQPSKTVPNAALGTEAAMIHSVLPIRISQTAPVRALTPSANSEAIVRDHIDANGEVDGVKLDMIPFVGDAAILLDDLPEQAPQPPPLPPEEVIASLPATVMMVKATEGNEDTDDAARTEAAERAYDNEKEVSNLPKAPVEAKFDTIDHQADQAEQGYPPAPPLDMIM